MAINNGSVLRPDLALLVNEYALEASRTGFVGTDIMPVWNSGVKTASYKVVKPGEMLKNVETDRAPGASYSRSIHAFETGNYTCKEYGHEEPIDDSEASANIGFDDEASAVRRCTDILLRAHERRVQAIATAQSGGAVGTPWATSASCTPKSDVKDAIVTVRNRIGIDPDLFVCPQSVFDDILDSADFKDRTKYVNNVEGVPEAQRIALVANYLGVAEIRIAKGIYNGADEGQTFSASAIWGTDEAFLLKRPQGGLADPGQFGRTVVWTQMGRSLVNVDNYREEQTSSQVYRTRMYTDEAVVNANAIWKFTNLD